MRIGIPRSLYAYYYAPLWSRFLEALGEEACISPVTNKTILDSGVASCVDDVCLPVKIFHGHVLWLDHNADAILLPQIMSVQKNEYSCPFICGLPEMVKFSTALEKPVFKASMNLHQDTDKVYKDLYALGNQFTQSKSAVQNAVETAFTTYYDHLRLMRSGYHPGALLDGKMQKVSVKHEKAIGIIAHPYLLYDDFTGKTVLNFLKEYGFAVLTPEMIRKESTDPYTALLPKKMFWSSGKRLYGSAGFMADAGVCGIIYITAFACGVDSMIADLAERTVRKKGLPFMQLTVDEHTGEAGLKTRLEAFCDMMGRRDGNGLDLSAYGQYLHSAQSTI